MNAGRLRPGIIIGVLLVLLFAIALLLRVYFPYETVFSGNGIKFTGADAYYHMRLVDSLVHNFPHLTGFDPYFIFPGGAPVTQIHFFNSLLAGIIWVIGLGSPTQHTIDVVSAYFPAVLGALTVIPVYFIGKAIFSRWAGVLAASLIAVLPGEFLGRSILGFTDYHVAEVLFSTIAVLFLFLAVKTSLQKGLTISHVKRLDWKTIRKPAIYSLLAGLSLGTYLNTWPGGLLFFLLISVYFIIQFIIDHIRQKNTDYLLITGTLLFFTAAIVFLPVYHEEMIYNAPLIIALFIPTAMYGISWLMARLKITHAYYYPLAIAGIGIAGLAIIYAASPSFFSSIVSAFKIFIPSGASLATLEAQPILFPGGNFTLGIVWGNFTTGFFLSLIALGIMIYHVIKHGEADKTLLVVWSLIILMATLGQRRFAYYFAVNVALLTGYLSWQFLRVAGFKKLVAESEGVSEGLTRERTGDKPKNGHKTGFRITIRQVNMALAVVIIFFGVFFPNALYAIPTASQARFAPSDAWYSSLTWLRENTSDPFGNPDFYYYVEEVGKYRSLSRLQRDIPNPSGDPDFYYQLEESYKYPESAYGIMSWWDYGYWITRIAHRIPNANGGQDKRAVTKIAAFFTSQDEQAGNIITEELGSSYIIIDYDTPNNKFWAISLWAGIEQTEFFDIYYLPQGEQLVPVRLYYPEYYRSLAVRLYNFDGKAVTPEVHFVISYEEMPTQEGSLAKVITGVEEFTQYEEAEAYISDQETANYKIVSDNPFISPVPMEALEHYQLIHSSESTLRVSEAFTIPEVKIFEYIE